MNQNFVNIKVDREERPDVDNIYMAAVQAMTQHGGWPMSVFLTPDGKPFFGGTYYPPTDGRGMPGFPRVLVSVAEAFRSRRDEIDASAGELVELIKGMGRASSSEGGSADAKLLDSAYRALSDAFDPANGGFGDAPKFPHPMDLKVLLRHHLRTGDSPALNMVRVSLDKMARGGIYDHLGGGFARYSTDDRWLAPHFEKMLYDNALLTSVYVEAFQQTRDIEYALVARETIEYVLGRHDRPRGRLLQHRGRRQRGRRGEVLRLVAGRDPEPPRRGAGGGLLPRLRRHRPRQLGTQEHPQPAEADRGSLATNGRPRGRSEAGSRGGQGPAVRRPGSPDTAGEGYKDPHVLEWP